MLSFHVPVLCTLCINYFQIVASDKLMSVLQNLYRRKQLGRFVIDEAHCVSQVSYKYKYKQEVHGP